MDLLYGYPYNTKMILDPLDVFVEVAVQGSFTAAARKLQMPVTTVSGKVALLERRLGVQLLKRTTRRLTLTQEGRLYLTHCQRALEEMREGERALSAHREEPQGLLRVTAAIDVGQSLLPHIVNGYLKRYPKVQVDLIITNRVVDLVSEGVDLAFRIGSAADSSLKARKLRNAEVGLWASAAWAERREIKHPRDLEKEPMVHFSIAGSQLVLKRNQQVHRFQPQWSVRVDDFVTARSLIEAGTHCGLLPALLCEEPRRTNLVRLLPDWNWSTADLLLVYPDQRFLSLTVRTFIDHAVRVTGPGVSK